MPQHDYGQYPVSELENMNLDRTTNPKVMTRGILGKDSIGNWHYLQCDSDGKLIIDPTDLDSRYVNVIGDTMTGVLKINPPDSISDPLFQVLTTGTYQYGFSINTLDFTGSGLGKYPILQWNSNGILGNVGAINPALAILGDTGGVNPYLMFIDYDDLVSMQITADFDWDGLGSNKFRFDDSVEINDLLNCDDLNVLNDLVVGAEFKGSRLLLTGGRQAAISADSYAMFGIGGTLAMSSTMGYVMPRNGSIVGLSAILNITTETTQGDIEIQARVNDNNVYSIKINSGGGGAAVKKGYGTQARGTDTFSAGDLIQLYINFDTFVGTVTGIAIICEVQFDT